MEQNQPPLIDLAYAAGLFDGEGSITLLTDKRQFSRCLRVSLASTSPSLLIFMAQTFGGKVYQTKQRAPGRKPIAEWAVNGMGAAKFIAMIAPFLREDRKRARAEMVLTELVPLMTRAGKNVPVELRDKRRDIEDRILVI